MTAGSRVSSTRALTYTAYGPIESLVVSDVEPPRAGPGEVGVDVRRAALDPKDALFRKGRFAWLSGHRFPKRCGLDYAAAVPLVALTALQVLRDVARVTDGSRVWIHGASGGVGTVAIQIARLLGARVTTTSSAANAARCVALGAHEVLDYREDNTAAPHGRVDVVFDVFGNLGVGEIAGVFAGRGAFVSTVPSAARFALDVVSRWSRIRQRLVVVRARRADLDTVGAWLAAGTLRAVIDGTYPLAEAHEAFRRLESKRARGKLVIAVA